MRYYKTSVEAGATIKAAKRYNKEDRVKSKSQRRKTKSRGNKKVNQMNAECTYA